MSDQDVIVGKEVLNPLGESETQRHYGGLISVEQQRAVAEVQARMIIARSNPRDQIRCMDQILQDCTRPGLAEGALYQYSRGGSSVSGPSIRLAETIARRWGNIASGIKELSRQNGYSECAAYAWDLETGYYDERQFQVKHWRDTKKGGYPITDERDIYEMIANMGQRRKRAVLLTVIPGDVVEAAVTQCEETLKASADTSPDALKKMVQFFGQYGVTQEHIEKRCQCRLGAIRPAQVVQLRKIYASLKDEMSSPEDWFDMPAPSDVAGRPKGNLDRFEERHGTHTQEEQPDPYEVADMTGTVGEFPTAEAAISAYRAFLAEGEGSKGEAGLTTVWDNNQGLMQRLDETGHDALSKELSTEYGLRRQAAANREQAEREAETKKTEQASVHSEPGRPGEDSLASDPPQAAEPNPKRAAVVDPARKPPEAHIDAEDGAGGASETNARLSGAAERQRSRPATLGQANPAGDTGRAGGKPAPPKRQSSTVEPAGQARLGLGVPEGEQPSFECPPVIVRGQPDWHIWVFSVFLPQVRKMENTPDMGFLLGDNEAHLIAARKAIDAADLKELDVAITTQWNAIGRAEREGK